MTEEEDEEEEERDDRVETKLNPGKTSTPRFPDSTSSSSGWLAALISSSVIGLRSFFFVFRF